jgi:hypothetical protein
VNRIVNEEEADRVLTSIVDPIQRNLVKVAIAKARMRFMRRAGSTEDQFTAQLPGQPFDLGFFASLMEGLFSNPMLIRRLLQGESVEDASEWPI